MMQEQNGIYILEDPSINLATKYLDPFHQPNRISVHLFLGLIKWKSPRSKWGSQDGSKINVRINYNCSRLIKESSQINCGAFGSVQLVNPTPNKPNSFIEGSSRLVGFDLPELWAQSRPSQAGSATKKVWRTY